MINRNDQHTNPYEGPESNPRNRGDIFNIADYRNQLGEKLRNRGVLGDPESVSPELPVARQQWPQLPEVVNTQTLHEPVLSPHLHVPEHVKGHENIVSGTAWAAAATGAVGVLPTYLTMGGKLASGGLTPLTGVTPATWGAFGIPPLAGGVGGYLIGEKFGHPKLGAAIGAGVGAAGAITGLNALTAQAIGGSIGIAPSFIASAFGIGTPAAIASGVGIAAAVGGGLYLAGRLAGKGIQAWKNRKRS